MLYGICCTCQLRHPVNTDRYVMSEHDAFGQYCIGTGTTPQALVNCTNPACNGYGQTDDTVGGYHGYCEECEERNRTGEDCDDIYLDMMDDPPPDGGVRGRYK